MASSEQKSDILIYANENLSEQIKFADGKAIAIITFKLVMLAFLRTQTETIMKAYEAGDWLVMVLFSSFMLSFMVSTLFVLKVIIPRIIKGRVAPSGIFFHEIAGMTKEDYLKFISEQSAEDLQRDIAYQNHSLSVIAEKKYANIHTSILFFGAANVCFWISILRASLI